MSELPKPDKVVTVREIASRDPELLKIIGELPQGMQEWFSNISFDIRLDVSSFTSIQYETTVMDQVALASMDPEQAADSIIKITNEATSRAFESVGHEGQAELVQWILKSYFPNSTVPIDLLAAIEKRLKPKEKTSG